MHFLHYRENGVNNGSSRKVYRFDRLHYFHRMHCLDTRGVVEKPDSEDEIEMMQVNGITKEQLVKLLTQSGLDDVIVLGLDGFKNAATILQIDDTLTGQSYYSQKGIENSDVPRIRRFWDIRRCFRWVSFDCCYYYCQYGPAISTCYSFFAV